MNDREPSLVTSELSRRFAKDGVSIELCIYRLDDEMEWSLEVVNERGTAIAWDETFPSDDVANAEFLRIVEDDGMTAFLDSAEIIQFPARPS